LALLHGGSERLGIYFDLYSLDEVSQYTWPLGRMLLFLPAALILVAVTFFKLKHALCCGGSNGVFLKYYHLTELITFTTFIGILSIWPSKIGVLYSFFLLIALFAVNRLEFKNRI